MTQTKLQPVVMWAALPVGSQRSAVLLNPRPWMQVLKTCAVCVSKLSVYGPVKGPVGVIWAEAAPEAATRDATLRTGLIFIDGSPLARVWDSPAPPGETQQFEQLAANLLRKQMKSFVFSTGGVVLPSQLA